MDKGKERQKGQGVGARKVSNIKVTFKVIQGHWLWCNLTGHIQFPFECKLSFMH